MASPRIVHGLERERNRCVKPYLCRNNYRSPPVLPPLPAAWERGHRRDYFGFERSYLRLFFPPPAPGGGGEGLSAGLFRLRALLSSALLSPPRCFRRRRRPAGTDAPRQLL